jgi:hypothetical protein
MRSPYAANRGHLDALFADTYGRRRAGVLALRTLPSFFAAALNSLIASALNRARHPLSHPRHPRHWGSNRPASRNLRLAPDN